PPQSTPSSAPFCSSSWQLAGAQVLVADAHTSSPSQSVSAPQATPAAQGGHVAPPQSGPLSSWFLRPSSQLGSAQRPSTQAPGAHSAWLAQPPASGHGGQGPPQSTP